MITNTKALNAIFEKNKTNSYRVWKHRFKTGALSIGVQEQLLRDNGYIKKKDSMWAKK